MTATVCPLCGEKQLSTCNGKGTEYTDPASYTLCDMYRKLESEIRALRRRHKNRFKHIKPVYGKASTKTHTYPVFYQAINENNEEYLIVRTASKKLSYKKLRFFSTINIYPIWGSKCNEDSTIPSGQHTP